MTREFLFSARIPGSHKEYHQYNLNNEYIDDIQFSTVRTSTHGKYSWGKFDRVTVSLTGFDTTKENIFLLFYFINIFVLLVIVKYFSAHDIWFE